MEQEQKIPAFQTLGAFTCNICGEHNVSSADVSAREQVTCAMPFHDTVPFHSPDPVSRRFSASTSNCLNFQY
jgi:hypothetical protein